MTNEFHAWLSSFVKGTEDIANVSATSGHIASVSVGSTPLEEVDTQVPIPHQ